MPYIVAGTAYGQAFQINEADKKKTIRKYGIMKKQRINCLKLHYEDNVLLYSSSNNIYQSFEDGGSNESTIVKQYQNDNNIIGFSIDKDDTIVFATNDGALKCIKNFDFTQQQQQPEILTILKGDTSIGNKGTKAYSKILYDGNDKHCLIGKGVLPFVYNSTKNVVSWKGKNVPNDELDLQVPINDTDAVFFKNSTCLACTHYDNRIRIYDIRNQKSKPSQDLAPKFDKVYNKTYLTKIVNRQDQQSHYFYVANDLGGVFECDVRKNMQVTGKLKGIHSTVTDIQILGDEIYTASLDCYVRKFNLDDKTLIEKHYMNKPLYSLLVYQGGIVEKDQQYDEQALSDIEQEQETNKKELKKMKMLRKRNKVGLNYLKEVDWSTVPVDQELLKEEEEVLQQVNSKDINDYVDDNEQIKDEHESDEDL